jgi:hypothetical protein
MNATVMNDDLLDSNHIRDHTADVTFKNGKSFSSMTRFFGAAILIVGLGLLLAGSVSGFILGLILIGGGGFIFTSTYGTDISTSTNYIREYHQIFFVKTGKWKTSAPYSDICIIKISKTAIRSDLAGANSMGIDISKNEIYLMTHDHRKRFLLKICKTSKEAAKEAKQLADVLDKKLAVFSPALSAVTQARLQQRR